MEKLSIIDTHCDTAYRLYHKSGDIIENDCHIDLKKAEKYENYAQFFAIFANSRRTDGEGYEDFLNISDYFRKNTEKNADRIAPVRTFSEMEEAWILGKRAAFLAVEDARILEGRLERLDELNARGVKYLTLRWGGLTCIGASHDAEGGLTDFGCEVVKRCFDIGIVPDISHANERVSDQVCEIAHDYKKPFIASHSNCYSVFPHTRNLRKKHLDAIIALGGTVGLSLCPYHIKENADDGCSLDDLMRHVEGYLEAGARDHLGLGCDLDGTSLPQGFDHVGSLDVLAEAMARRNYPDELIEKIFWRNHFEFIKRNF